MEVSNYASVKFGSDPEAFFQNPRGQIIGSELVIPKKLKFGTGEVVRDGVQLEIHVNPDFCRELFADNLGDAFVTLKEHLAGVRNKERASLSFKAVVRVTQGQLNRLSDQSRRLGCAPSENIYDPKAKINVNPVTYKIRSAGGHVHLGLSAPKLKSEYRRIIRQCDILLGNQCVMLDREPLMALRRRVYGRAGECRPQKYGVEYRTLSNFWLRSEPLVSFVLAMARNAVHVISTTEGIVGGGDKWNAEKAIFDFINIRDIIKAINKNDFDLAMKNFEGIEKFIKEFMPLADGLNLNNVHLFKRFALDVEKNGIEKWFPESPLEYWNNNRRRKEGWEAFLRRTRHGI